MKNLVLLLFTLLPQHNAFAEKGSTPDEADYVVPTSKELVAHSRFKVKIGTPYAGTSSDTISYTFPVELTGIVDNVITFQRVGKTNEWESPEMTASCTESESLFSCNVYLIKTPFEASINTPKKGRDNFIPKRIIKEQSSSSFIKFAAFDCGKNVSAFQQPVLSTTSFIDEANVEAFLKSSGFSGETLKAKMSVARAFACSEPAGILSYEFK